MGHIRVPKGPKGRPRRGSFSVSPTRPETVHKANPDIRKYVQKTLKLDNKESWLSYPEIPTAQEIMGQTGAIDLEENMIDLPTNEINEPWDSPNAYLSTHYELLREDSVALLRDAVALVRDEPTMTDTQEVCIYEKVYITGVTLSPKGVATKISFSTTRAGKNIVWEYSSRLITGSMVALSPSEDCFQTRCLVAAVAARPLEQLKGRPRQIDIFFADPSNAPFDPQEEWIMVQPRSGYLEANRHTMKTLQVMNNEVFPFSEHICDLKPEIGYPAYVEENSQVKLFTNEYIDILSDWPSEPQNNLDESQWEALHQILTRRLAIIQGPPGTGKTHVSVSALRVFMSNWRPKDPPVIVTAHTNHALDQLLNHISDFVPDYIRLGGRSLDENVKRRTLFEKLDTLRETMAELLSPFSGEELHEPLPATFFLQHGVITDKQYELLCDGANQWTGSSTEPMSIWLGDAFSNHRVSYDDDSFKQEQDEADLEYEQLIELGQEHDCLDDELEALKGLFLPLREPFIGLGDSDEGEESETDIEDLWQILPGRRGSVYNTLRQRAKTNLVSVFRENFLKYNATTTDRQIGKWEHDYVVLKDAKLIGMTTTGLSKYRALLSALKPRIIMIEEAAETIEAPITAACVESLEHLILVGDHKQLQGSCSIRELEDVPYYLNVSMFERLVKNGIDFRTLTLQRRMVPAIRRLLTPIYDNIQDHETVNNLAKVPGMGDLRSFFFSHCWMENSDSLLSKYNQNEALMIATFFVYLVLAGVDSSHITVLTFYNGQRKKILKLLKSNKHLQGRHLKVCTVDSYQGEENEIVLLSLVRSSERNGIGFLKVENRVCVALSRARRGFYMFGNAEHLAGESHLWMKVVSIMSEADAETTTIARYIPLVCEKHGNQEFSTVGMFVHYDVTISTILTSNAKLLVEGRFRAGIHVGIYVQRRLVRRAAYQQFVKGSVKDHDRQLAATMQAESAQDMLARLDAEAEANLFADDELGDFEVGITTGASATGAVLEAERDASSNIINNTPCRRRWVDSYDPSEGLKKLTVSHSEMSLLDLLD
uniref:Helicase required for RNAi-mediated heterochromatin assembly 1 n=1 Tax=Talaromyces marneffei PM1 TaxID=1077442 RepID=A0A093V1D0_TALMA